jgi:hypothetical protein
MRQWPPWIVEPPLGTGERMSVNDPIPPLVILDSRRTTNEVGRR